MISEFVQTVVAPILKSHKFRKNGFRWDRSLGDIVQVITIQASQWNDEAGHSFTLNFGVCVKQVWMIIHGTPLPRTIPECECFPIFRVGDVMDDNSIDLWWTIEDFAPEELSREVQKVIRETVIKILDNCNSVEKVLSLVIERKKRLHPYEMISYSVLNFLCNKQDEAKKILDEMLEGNKSKFWENTIQAVKERLDYNSIGIFLG